MVLMGDEHLMGHAVVKSAPQVAVAYHTDRPVAVPPKVQTLHYSKTWL
jgi:hypothetical protein